MLEQTEKKALRCSFCGKSQDDVEQLIAGRDVFICNKCVEICVEIINAGKKSKKTDLN